MKTFSAAQTRQALSFPLLITCLREMFIQGCEVPQRHTHTIQAPDGQQGALLIMPAWCVDSYLGIKTVSVFPGNAQRNLPGLFSSYLLCDASTGAPLAHIDGNEITVRRTAATSALAASLLTPEQPQSLLIVGAGRVAAQLAQAYASVRTLSQVQCWARDPRKAQTLVEQLGQQGIHAHATADLESACRHADIVSCATLSSAPLIQGAWLKPHGHLDLIGSFAPHMCEADDACFANAAVYVDNEDAWEKSGDLLGPMDRGVLVRSGSDNTLGALCQKADASRPQAKCRTVFKSVGSALEDLAAAILVYESAA
jgi:ornithine cyclodeaminase